jgi:hypothetical protein
MAVQISTNVEFIQANTTTNAGFILLPSTTTVAGRLLTIKDTAGTFGLRPLTLSTIGNDRFEDGVNLKRLVEPFGYITLASDGANRWYTIDGTSMNTYTISTLTNRISISTQSIFTSSVTVSTLGFEDRDFNSVSSFYTRSTLLYLGSNIIGGSKCGPTLFVPIRRPFLPNQISGLRFWLDAADVNTITLVNGAIRDWRDKTGINRSLVVTGTPRIFNSPLLNFLPTIRFNGSTDNLLYNTFTLSQPLTVFAVTVQRASSAAGFSFVIEPSISNSAVIIYRSGPILFYFAGTNVAAVPTVTYFTNITGIYSAVFNSSASFLGFNGAGTSNQNPGTSGWTNLNLGRNWSGNWQDQDVAEVLFYNSALSEINRQQVEGYLAWKWGLVGNLPASHPFKNAPP